LPTKLLNNLLAIWRAKKRRPAPPTSLARLVHPQTRTEGNSRQNRRQAANGERTRADLASEAGGIIADVAVGQFAIDYNLAGERSSKAGNNYHSKSATVGGGHIKSGSAVIADHGVGKPRAAAASDPGNAGALDQNWMGESDGGFGLSHRGAAIG